MPGNAKKKCPTAGHLYVQVKKQNKTDSKKWGNLERDLVVKITPAQNVDNPTATIQKETTFKNLCAGNYSLELQPHPYEAILPITEKIDKAKTETEIGSGKQQRSVVIVDNKTTMHYYRLYQPLLELTKVDPHFAPSVDVLDITYNICGYMDKEVKFQIFGLIGHNEEKLFERPLTAKEKKDGNNKPLKWDGKLTEGDRNGRHATPLMGPFEVRLSSGKDIAKKPFKILYHSIKLDWGKHTPDGKLPPESEKIKYAQARLNELGYDAGPVNGTLGPVTQRALVRFQRANYVVGKQKLLPVDGALNDETFAAIKKASARDIWESGKTPLTQDAKFYIYDNFMNDPGMDFVTGTQPEFNAAAAGARKQYAEDKIERPYLPLEVEILLLSKGNSGVSAPDAVGAVPVAWEVNDGPEDASVITHAPAKEFVKNARQIGYTTTRKATAARIDGNGDNALQGFQGIRSTDSATYIKALFPSGADSVLAPYSVSGADTETRSGKEYHRAIVKAWDHASDHTRCKGRAGAYFRFSKIGGDDAKIRVSLAFKGLPNAADLDKDHASAASRLVKETGRWTIWRRTRISAYCTQVAAPPRPSGLPNWTTIRDFWKEAFIEIENSGQPLQTLNYASIVTESVYRQAILAIPDSWRDANNNLQQKPPVPGTDQAQVNLGGGQNIPAVPRQELSTGVMARNFGAFSEIVYHSGSMFGGNFPPQHPKERALKYVERMGRLATAWVEHPINAILKVIHDEARKTSPEGFVIFDFRIHEPVSGQDWDGSLNRGRGAFKPTTNPSAKNYIAGTSGYVQCAGAVTMNVDNRYNVNCYLCHECGHARFLYHHITDDVHSPGVSDNPNHHDTDQPRCTMSYGIGSDTEDLWRFAFCGKCILRLRGWNITALPNRYT